MVALTVILLAYQITPLSIPSNQVRFAGFQAYLNETALQWSLPAFRVEECGLGMTSEDNEVYVLNNGGPTYDRMLEEMSKATRSINLEVYTWHDDQVGREFQRLLASKAQEGVKIKILTDALGSVDTPKSFFKELEAKGVEVAVYNPLLIGFVQGRSDNRLHRKVVVIDGRLAYVGGGNIGDEYLGMDKRIGAWRDTGVLVKGSAVLSLQQTFLYDWLQATGKRVSSADYYHPPDVERGTAKVRIALGGPDSPLSTISTSYSHLIGRANHEIKISTPYFIPDRTVLEAIYQACERGIEVQLLVPRKADNPVAQLATQYYLNKVLQKGVKVFNYNPGFIHNKIIIVDQEIASVGTANFDYMSFSKNYEANAILFDQHTVQLLRTDYAKDLGESTEASDNLTEKRGILQSSLERLAVLLIHLL